MNILFCHEAVLSAEPEDLGDRRGAEVLAEPFRFHRAWMAWDCFVNSLCMLFVWVVGVTLRPPDAPTTPFGKVSFGSVLDRFIPAEWSMDCVPWKAEEVVLQSRHRRRSRIQTIKPPMYEVGAYIYPI